MISTEDLKSVQDAEQPQGSVLISNNQTANYSSNTAALGNLKLKKDNTKQVLKLERKASLAKNLFPEENKENEAPNDNVQSTPQRSSRRIAGLPLTEEEQFLYNINAHDKKTPIIAPPIKYPHRFEKTPAQLKVVPRPYQDESKKKLAIPQEKIDKDLKNLKNFKEEKVQIESQKVNGVRICKDANDVVLEKYFTVKLTCTKLTFFASPLLPTDRRRHFGNVRFDQSIMDSRIKKIEELNKKSKTDIKTLQKVSLDKINENEDYLLSIQPAPQVAVKEFFRVPVTWDVIKRWQRIAQSGRKPSQCDVMGISAGEYVQLFGFDDPLDLRGKSNWEWLHLLAFSLGGPDNKYPQLDKNWDGDIKNLQGPQSCRNLVAGPVGTNTWMMIGEFPPHYLLVDHKAKVEKVFISARAELFPNTHIAKKILYTIAWTPKGCTEEKSVSFKFNPLRFDAPTKALENYLRKIIDREMKHQHTQNDVSNTTTQNKVALKPQFIDLDEVDELNNNNNNQNNDDVTPSVSIAIKQ